MLSTHGHSTHLCHQPSPSSPAPPPPLTRHDSTAASSSASHSRSLSSRAARRSLSVLGSLPKEISALIRSHSSSRRQHHRHDSDIDADSLDMLQDDDRPSRKSKSENRLYNFLTRSRSRSRSKNGRLPSQDPQEPVLHLPQNGRTRTDSADPSTPSKPPSRLQSRPLSSTTTATNTTITPGTPRARKRPPSAIPIPEPDNTVEPQHSRPTTPKHSAARKKLHNLFGIPLSSPRKSSFSSSRQSSRRPSYEHPPPLPGHESEHEDTDPTPKPRKSFSPHPNSRPESPSPVSRKLPTPPSSSSTHTSSTSTSSRFQKFFTGHRTPPLPAVPSADNVSGPIRRPSGSSHYRSNSSGNAPHRLPSPDVPLSRIRTTGTMGPPPVPPPKIVHTPATPLRSESSPRPGTAPNPRLGQRKNSVDSGYRPRATAAGGMDVVDEGSARGKGKERDPGGSINGTAGSVARPRVHGHGHGHAARSTKHGSFDFERPGWSAGVGAIQRSGSGGTTGTSTTGTSGGWSRNVDVLGGIRESAMGPGLAGVGTLQRDASVKRGKEREEMLNRVREEEKRRRRADQEKEKEGTSNKHRSLQPPPRASEESSTGKTSSLGKKRGGLFRSGSASGKSRVAALGLSHGPFAFEPAVPSPTRSTGSVGTAGGAHEAPLSVSWGGERGRAETEKDRERARIKGDAERQREKERWKEKEREKRFHSYRGDRAPVPVPVPSVGHRSGTKGRSLDLGLGLAWAPTKVREDALLPASGYFGRSLSGASSLGGRSASGSTAGTGATDERETSKVGREVANVFKNALDDEGYAAFKKYVHRFDAHEIPFDGPTGIVARVEQLLTTAPALGDEGKRRLLDSFVRVVLQNA